MPARYQYTPRGYIYCSGYWDYPVPRRGVLFSPVHFRNRRTPYRYSGYRYRPRLVVSAGPLLVHLFVRPLYRHYYFGDYYDPRYRDRGIFPFTQQNRYARRGYAYDPLRTYYQVSSRRTTYNRLVGWNSYFNRNAAYRPPRTNKLMVQFSARNRNFNTPSVIRQATLGSKISALTDRQRPDHRTFHKISMNDRDQISNRVSKAVRDLTSGRHQFERTAGKPGGKGTLASDRSNRGPSLGDRKGNDRGDGRGEVASLKLPKVNQFRDRLSSTQGSRADRDSNSGSPSSLNRDQKRPSSPSDRGRSDGSRDGSNRISQRLTPSDLRSRIESARGNGSGKGNRVESINPSSRPRNEASSNRQRPSTSSNDRLTDIRSRIEATRKQQSGSPSVQSGRVTGRDSSSRAGSTSRSTTGSSDLRSRIEAARQAAEQKRSTNRSSNPPTRSLNRAVPTNRPTTSTPRSTSSSATDLRSRIEAARKQQSGSPSIQSGRGTGPDSNNRAGSTSRSTTGSSDLRSRIEAARQAAEKQRATSRSSNPPTRSNVRSAPTNRPTTSAPRSTNSPATDLRSRIEAARRSAESRSSSTTRSRSVAPTSSLRNQPSRVQPQRSSPTPKVETRRPSTSRPSIQDSIRSTRSRIESRSSSTQKARSAPPSRSTRPTARPSRGVSRARSKRGK